MFWSLYTGIVHWSFNVVVTGYFGGKIVIDRIHEYGYCFCSGKLRWMWHQKRKAYSTSSLLSIWHLLFRFDYGLLKVIKKFPSPGILRLLTSFGYLFQRTCVCYFGTFVFLTVFPSLPSGYRLSLRKGSLARAVPKGLIVNNTCLSTFTYQVQLYHEASLVLKILV